MLFKTSNKQYLSRYKHMRYNIWFDKIRIVRILFFGHLYSYRRQCLNTTLSFTNDCSHFCSYIIYFKKILQNKSSYVLHGNKSIYFNIVFYYSSNGYSEFLAKYKTL